MRRGGGSIIAAEAPPTPDPSPPPPLRGGRGAKHRPRSYILVTRTCSTAVRPLRTALTERAIAAGTAAGSLTFSP